MSGDICPECGSGILDGEHIANYPCSRRDANQRFKPGDKLPTGETFIGYSEGAPMWADPAPEPDTNPCLCDDLPHHPRSDCPIHGDLSVTSRVILTERDETFQLPPERDANQLAQRTTETQETVAALDKIERLIRKGERDSRLLDARDFKMRPYSEAYRLLVILRERAIRND